MAMWALYGRTLWAPCDPWAYPVDIPYGHTLWAYPVGTLWECPMGTPCGQNFSRRLLRCRCWWALTDGAAALEPGKAMLLGTGIEE